jgi:hypothetical protein
VTHPILERLASPDPEVRQRACLEAADDPAAVLLAEALGEALGDPDRGVARAARDALAAIGRGGADLRAVLRAALRSESPARRFGAALTSARLGAPEPALLPPLVEALGCGEGDERWIAARLLVEVGQRHGEVLLLLLGLARTGESALARRMACHCLRELAPDLPETAAALVAASRDADPGVRRAALAAMASLREPPASVAERLLAALDSDGDPASRRIATVGLGAHAGAAPPALREAALRALERAVAQAGDDGLRRGAARALERLGRGA